MASTQTISLDPFSFWPKAASAIEGLGGAEPGPRNYVFHTVYCYVDAGANAFEFAFEGLRATSGSLRVNVMEQAPGTGRFRKRVGATIALAELAAAPGRLPIRFHAREGVAYALRAALVGRSDATATGVEVALERPGDERFFVESLDRARRDVYDRPSSVEKRWWRERSPVDEARLIVDRKATLADPVSQMCTAAQFAEPGFARWATAIGSAVTYHRKLWEFGYILSVLESAGMMRPGARALGFGVGAEALPSLFASMDIEVVATDLAAGNEAASTWAASGQHADDLSRLHVPALCDRDAFDRNVSFRPVDMNAIPDDLRDFDFCWSACAYEHLGSIEAGLRFFRESMRCLKPGGIAVHTTELNLTSNDRTLSKGATVLFRRRDMERLALQLHRDGHEVWPITYDQGDQPVDQHIDIPPYLEDEHLKIALASYVTTSFGLAARKAAA